MAVTSGCNLSSTVPATDPALLKAMAEMERFAREMMPLVQERRMTDV